jgi:hypothetical protein
MARPDGQTLPHRGDAKSVPRRLGATEEINLQFRRALFPTGRDQ